MAIVAEKNTCANMLLTPFKHGWTNLESAWYGRRVEYNPNDARPEVRQVELSCAERVAAFVIGIFLLIPLINVAVLALLKIFDSKMVSPIHEKICPANVPLNDEEIFLQGRVDGAALLHTAFVSPREPAAAPEEYARRKQECIESLNRDPYSTFQQNPEHVPFHCNLRVVNFNLDAILNRFNSNHDLGNFYELFTYAGVEPLKIANITDTLQRRYSGEIGDQELMAKQLLSKIYDFFNQKKPLFAGTDKEDLFKTQIRDICDRLRDAHINCVDQVTSQLESIAIDVIANYESANGGAISLKDYLIQRAAYTNLQYRTDLIKQICLMEYSQEGHAADLERKVKQHIGELVGLDAEIFKVGARFNPGAYPGLIANIASIFFEGRALDPARIPDPQSEFFLRDPAGYRQALHERQRESIYDPQQYLINNLRVYHGNARTLRNDMLLWARQYFDLETDDALTEQFITAISADPDVLDASDGGDLKYGALLYFLEKIGILQA